jgi:hypothetical protein
LGSAQEVKVRGQIHAPQLYHGGKVLRYPPNRRLDAPYSGSVRFGEETMMLMLTIIIIIIIIIIMDHCV